MENSRYKPVLGQAPFGYALLETVADSRGNIGDYRFADVNPAFEEVAGRKAEEILGKTIKDIFPAASFPDFNWTEFLGRVSVKGGAQSAEMFFEKPDRWYNVQVYPAGPDNLAAIFTDITLQKNHEEEARRSENNLRNLFDANVDFNWVVDERGFIIHIDSTIKSRLGYTKEELIGKRFTDIYPAGRRKEAKQAFEAILEGRDDLCTVPLITKSGEEIPVETYIFSGVWDGKPALFSVSRDMTALKLSEEKFSKAFESNPMALTISRLDTGRLIDVNPRFELITGFSREEIIGRRAIDIGVWADPENRSRIISKLKKNRSVRDQSVTFRSKSGEVLDWRVAMEIIEIKGVECIISIIEDFTERKLAEAALRESEEKYRHLAENISDVVWTTDLSIKLIWVSPSVKRILGFTPEEYRRRTVRQNFPSRYLKQFIELLREERMRDSDPELDKNRTRIIEAEHYKSDGSLVWLAMHITFIRDGKGQITGLQGVSRDITERKKAEIALQASEERLRQIIDLVPHFIFVKDINGKFIIVNKATADAYGTTVEKLTGMTDADFAKSEEEVRFFRENDTEVINSGTPRIIPEEKITDSRGKVRYLSTTKIPFTFSEKELSAVLGVAVDITEQRWVEEQNRKLSQAVEQSPVSIVITDLNGTIEYVNPKFTEVTGYHFNEAIGQNPRILKSGRMHESEYEELWKTITSGREWQGEFHNRKRNGELYWEYATISPIRNEEGRITHFIGVKEDITERKKREELLKFQEDLRQVLIDISSSYINLPLHEVESSINNSLAVMGRFVSADRAYIFDLDPDTMLCSNTYEWCNEGVSLQINNLQEIQMPDEWNEAFIKGEAVIIPDVLAMPRGYVRDVLEPQDIKSLIVIPMMSDGACIGFIGFDSVNEYHVYSEVEQQLLQLYCQMMVNIKLRKKTEEELIRAKEKAEESNLLKTHFLANMSHEIRTPMNGIIGFLQLLQDMDMTREEKDSYIEILNNSGQRLLDTIKDIIEMSKIETGHIPLDISETDLPEVMQFTCDFFRQQSDEKGLQLNMKVAPECEELTIMTDKLKLEAVLSNLLKNAIKFTSEGGIEFGNYLDGALVNFYVRDTGTGIPPDRLDAIFEMFVQADLSTARPYEGSGLGLSIARAYLEKLGGRIWVESDVGTGSTFYFSLPYIPAEKLPDDTKVDEETAGSIEPGHTILVAEDDDASYQLIEAFLVNQEVKLLRTATGQDTVTAVRDNPSISLVLMDIKMPGMNGLEATRKIREFNKRIPVIAQTAYAMPGDRDLALDAGCNDYLSKPVKMNELLLKINQFTIKKPGSLK